MEAGQRGIIDVRWKARTEQKTGADLPLSQASQPECRLILVHRPSLALLDLVMQYWKTLTCYVNLLLDTQKLQICNLHKWKIVAA